MFVTQFYNTMIFNPRRTRTAAVNRSLQRARRATRANFITKIATARRQIFAEAARKLSANEHMLQLALNEAESLAWQTRYPHLVFPALAAEKVQSLAQWKQRQESVLEGSPTFALAE
jgi:hypothetical protein